MVLVYVLAAGEKKFLVGGGGWDVGHTEQVSYPGVSIQENPVPITTFLPPSPSRGGTWIPRKVSFRGDDFKATRGVFPPPL